MESSPYTRDEREDTGGEELVGGADGVVRNPFGVGVGRGGFK